MVSRTYKAISNISILSLLLTTILYPTNTYQTKPYSIVTVNPYTGTDAVWAPTIVHTDISISIEPSPIYHFSNATSKYLKSTVLMSTQENRATMPEAVMHTMAGQWREGSITTGSMMVGSTIPTGSIHASDRASLNAARYTSLHRNWTSTLTMTVTITENEGSGVYSATVVSSSQTVFLDDSTSMEPNSHQASSTVGGDSTITLTAKSTDSVISTSSADINPSSTLKPSLTNPPTTELSSSTTETISPVNMSSSSMFLSASAISTTPALYRGFNIINQSPTNPSTFKTLAHWAQAFRNILSIPGSFNAVRLYSTTDGPNVNHLLNAIPAARALNLSMHVGVWSGGDAHTVRFTTEKAALTEGLALRGCDNIMAVSVGNEDMYSHHRTDAGRTPLHSIALLVNQALEIRDLLTTHNCTRTKLTHTDTFGDWLQTNISAPLISVLDVLTVNIFPYWSGTHIANASATFFAQLKQTQEMAAKYHKEIWIGETGWPVSGETVGDAVPSVENARVYWNEVWCGLLKMNLTAFWYVEFDAGAGSGPSFGVLDRTGRSVLGDLGCG